MGTEINVPEFPIVDVGFCDRCGEFVRIMDFGAMGEEYLVVVICPNCGKEIEVLEWQ